MIVKVLTFGVAREITGSAFVELDMGVETTAGCLMQDLKIRYPALQHLKSLTIAVNSEYASNDRVIYAGDEVAIIPPVSGG